MIDNRGSLRPIPHFAFAAQTDSGGDEFGTLEELESAESVPFPEERLKVPIEAKTSELIKDLVSSYSIIPIPVVIVDSSLKFLYKNEPFERLMSSFNITDKSTLFGVIGRFLTPETAKDLYTSLKDQARGYSWGGTIRLRSRESVSVMAKTTIVPFKPTVANGSSPRAWVAFFDDMTAEQNGFLRGLFTSLLEASKLKDNDTGRHIQRVNYYAQRMAEKMFGKDEWPEIDADFVENIGFLAAMHDVGKIGTPDDILNKKGPLDEFEWGIMKEHTINGAFILSSYPNPMAKQIAQSHHEWWNGTGYPYKLVGDMIPLPARIVALADVYDALRMKRSYKKPFEHARASLLILAEGDKHFDPRLTDVFKAISHDFDAIYTANVDES